MRYAALIFLVAASAWGQISDGLTTNASRTVLVTPDEADFTVLVTVSLDTTLSQVTQAIQDLGVTSPAVTAVAVGTNNYSYPPPSDSQLYYLVTFSTAPSAMVQVSKKLDALRAALPSGFTAVQYSAALTPSAAAIQTAHDATLPKLLADAQASAEKLAAASGLKLGAIAGISDTTYPVYGYFLQAAISTGAFSSSNTSNSGGQYTFGATVRFKVQ